MGATFGRRLTVTLFGQSHSQKIGCVVNGLPAGLAVDEALLCGFLARRRAGEEWTTTRHEPDIPVIVSGVVAGLTCGAPICIEIENKAQNSADYAFLPNTPRPSHADFGLYAKYGENADFRGGGVSSGRLTAALCAAGWLCLQFLLSRGIKVGAHLYSVGTYCDTPFDAVALNADTLYSAGKSKFPTVDAASGELMKSAIAAAQADGDSLGGIVECGVLGLPSGVGEPMFDGLESRISSALFAIPAVKGVEFGSGFESCKTLGSENNDPFTFGNGAVKTLSNNSGGLLGGISDGMPLILRAGFKPTPSISKTQKTVDLAAKADTELSVSGRHDPCIAPRAVPCVEAATAIAIADAILFN